LRKTIPFYTGRHYIIAVFATWCVITVSVAALIWQRKHAVED
jgi:hypothetical protein